MTRMLLIFVAIALLCPSLMATSDDRALFSAERTINITLQTSADSAFLLFGPVEEKKWDSEWRPSFLYQAGPQEHPSFAVLTNGAGDNQSTWVISAYDLSHRHIQYVSIRPGRVLTLISIRCVAIDEGTSRAEITYRRTALTQASNQAVEHFAQQFTSQGRHWEQVLNQYLSHTGKSTSNSNMQKQKGM